MCGTQVRGVGARGGARHVRGSLKADGSDLRDADDQLHVRATADAAGDVDWDINVDSTSVRAHQHAAGARNDPPARPAVSTGVVHRDVRLCLPAFPEEAVRAVSPSAGPAAG
ncbi:hypothetical protein [Streptomyces sp. ISL-11]|uniref:hypothetical protein n=1 Tax=Streptomyces sp. ISL-11 TaxID=2819174 RepID=UPI001BED37CB|nr:hypothetical protein [Streptomyces sp. ISL-11]